jgi:hypothetical protein
LATDSGEKTGLKADFGLFSGQLQGAGAAGKRRKAKHV